MITKTHKFTTHLAIDRTGDGRPMTEADRLTIAETLENDGFVLTLDPDDSSNYTLPEGDLIILGDVQWDEPMLKMHDGQLEVIVTFYLEVSTYKQKTKAAAELIDDIISDCFQFSIDGYETYFE
jgi:hypothetical protein